MKLKLIGSWTLALAFAAVPPLHGAEQPTGSPDTPFPSPPTPPATETPAGAVTQPFKPAVRIPRALPVAAISVLTNLVFDAEVKENKFETDVFEHDFTFSFTNISDAEVVIKSVSTSCGCTVAQLPPLPWTNAPAAAGSFGVHMDLRGKRGSITKSVFVMTNRGNKMLYVRGVLPDLPAMTADQRERNLSIAKANRQSVFKGDCASCHATPAFGKTGLQLYEAACAICHEGGHRNEMVPDLSIAKQPRDYEYWRNWIINGKEGTLMPAFGKPHGGPLTDAQILSLAHFLTRKFPDVQTLPGNPSRLNNTVTR